MAMEFYVVDGNLDVIGIIDAYKSAIWTERYYEPGDFELYVAATPEAVALIRKHLFLVRMDNVSKAMVIETIKLSTDAENGDYLTVSGRSLSSILSRRIIWKQTTYSGQLEKAVRRMIADSFVDPEDADRTVSFFELGEEAGITDEIKVQYAGEVVQEAIENVCRPKKIGYECLMDLSRKKITFRLYEGKDRSYNQTANPFVVFSPKFDNLLSSSYSNSDAKLKNVAQVAGEGEGTARKKVTVGTASGLERYETFVDAKGQSTNDGEITESTYAELLEQKGLERLATLATTEKIDSEVAPNYSYKVNEDYFLGDVVEVINEYGIAMTPRVVEVIECQNDAGYTCIPTFSADE